MSAMSQLTARSLVDLKIAKIFYSLLTSSITPKFKEQITCSLAGQRRGGGRFPYWAKGR